MAKDCVHVNHVRFVLLKSNHDYSNSRQSIASFAAIIMSLI